jgi:UDP-glucose 4-epimerase
VWLRIGLIGKSGLIGGAAHRELSLHHDIVTFGRSSQNDVYLDLNDVSTFDRETFNGIDALVHCAGVTDEDLVHDGLKGVFANVSQAFAKSTVMLDHLLDHAVLAGVRRFSYVSSAHVYGPLSGRIDEQTIPQPLTYYSLSHYCAEQVYRKYALQGPKDIHLQILRPCAVYGMPTDFKHFRRWKLVPYYLPRMALERGRIDLLPGSDRVYRNFISSKGVGSALTKIADMFSSNIVVSNPLGAENMSIYSFAERVAQAYESVMGQACPVTMIGDSVPISAPLVYTSLDPVSLNDEPLDVYLSDFMRHYRAFLKKD